MPRSPADRRDRRPYIYAGLDIAFTALYAVIIVTVIPTRIRSTALQLWSLPLCTIIMALGTASIFAAKLRARGRKLAIAGATLMLASTILLIVRVLVSAAFLAGVYGAFGKAAASFALVAVALVVELVALLPIVQVKYLLSRAGKRAYGG
ncbi:MAG TPA: hypothetical protein VH143_14910 [Kofleriaceae bacterium]|jgi:hypothetical protein|nr:hypothetical protein [Kofleriaceae bacterium]